MTRQNGKKNPPIVARIEIAIFEITSFSEDRLKDRVLLCSADLFKESIAIDFRDELQH